MVVRAVLLFAVITALAVSGAWAGDKEEAVRLRKQGMNVYQGLGVPRDDAKAVGLLERAASLGDLTAQVNLAKMYEYGLSVAQSDARSAHWYLEAARQGDALAQFRAGEILYLGHGLPRDRMEAITWWTRALAGATPAQREWMLRTVESLREPITAAELGRGPAPRRPIIAP